MIHDSDRLRGDLPYHVPATPYNVYVGTGDAGVGGSDIVQFQRVNSPPPLACVVVLSPRSPGQKCYFANRATSPDFRVYMSGFEVPMLADREVSVGVTLCRVKETADLMIGIDVPFELRTL